MSGAPDGIERRGTGGWDEPDLLANAGGVTVSYYEWAQDASELRAVYP